MLANRWDPQSRKIDLTWTWPLNTFILRAKVLTHTRKCSKTPDAQNAGHPSSRARCRARETRGARRRREPRRTTPGRSSVGTAEKNRSTYVDDCCEEHKQPPKGRTNQVPYKLFACTVDAAYSYGVESKVVEGRMPKIIVSFTVRRKCVY